MVDPIADTLNRIRNAQAVKLETVNIPFSKLKYEIVKILERKNFIKKTEKKGRKTKKFIELTLKYEGNQKGIISGLKRVSRPGKRVYKNFKEIKKVRQGYGIAIISTSRGLMTDSEARKQKMGGEVICEVW